MEGETSVVESDERMGRASARQAEAGRSRRAKIINAGGEGQAAQKLVDAGATLAGQENAMLLRYFGTLHDIAGNRTSTIVLPIPMELFSKLKG